MSVTIVRYGVRDMLSDEIKYKGTRSDCAKYLDKNPEQWLVCEIIPLVDESCLDNVISDDDWD